MKLLFISSVVPKDTISGEIVLYRHFSDLENIELLVVSDGPVPGFPHRVIQHRLPSRMCIRLARTRFHRWGRDGQLFCEPGNSQRLASICQDFKPDVIMTVAHGE